MKFTPEQQIGKIPEKGEITFVPFRRSIWCAFDPHARRKDSGR
jgi:hypothetical protein